MKNLAVAFKVPAVFVSMHEKTLLVPSMVLTTLSICFLTTFIPQLMPLWMQIAPAPSKWWKSYFSLSQLLFFHYKQFHKQCLALQTVFHNLHQILDQKLLFNSGPIHLLQVVVIFHKHFHIIMAWLISTEILILPVVQTSRSSHKSIVLQTLSQIIQILNGNNTAPVV